MGVQILDLNTVPSDSRAWLVREKDLDLMTDPPTLTYGKIAQRRDVLQQELANLYQREPLFAPLGNQYPRRHENAVSGRLWSAIFASVQVAHPLQLFPQEMQP